MPRKINYLRNQQARVSVITSELPGHAMLNYIHQSKEMAHGPKQSFSTLNLSSSGPSDHHGRETNISLYSEPGQQGLQGNKGLCYIPMPQWRNSSELSNYVTNPLTICNVTTYQTILNHKRFLPWFYSIPAQTAFAKQRILKKDILISRVKTQTPLSVSPQHVSFIHLKPPKKPNYYFPPLSDQICFTRCCDKAQQMSCDILTAVSHAFNVSLDLHAAIAHWWFSRSSILHYGLCLFLLRFIITLN